MKIPVFSCRVMRSVVGGHGVHAAVCDTGDERAAVCARGERRIHFVVRIVADVFIAEREVMRRDLAGDAHAEFLGVTDIFERAGGGHVRDVQAGAGENGEFDVASGADGFGFRGNAFQAETDGARPFAHHAAGEERGIFAVVDHGKIQRVAVVHYLAHQARGGYGLAVVADGDDTGIFHRGDFRQGFALAANRGRADRPDLHGPGSSGAFNDGACDRGVVVYRLRVR